MVVEDPTGEIVMNLLCSRLHELRRVSGLPVVFGGPVRSGANGERLLVINQLSGTVSEALRELPVPAGRGLGGVTVAIGRPRLCTSYKDDESISHDFDIQVVDRERISSVFAFPVRVRGEVEGVFYGAVRDSSTIGDEAIRSANAVARGLETEVGRLLGHTDGATRRTPTASRDLDLRVRVAVDELGQIMSSTSDDELRQRLERIRSDLDGRPRSARSSSLLSPRELEALRLAAVGATNAEIAAELQLTPQTVKSYMRNVMRKLEVRNRSAAVHVARLNGEL